MQKGYFFIKMDICFKNIGDTLWVALIGELDHHSARGIGEKIDFEIMFRQPVEVCLDFDKLDFMDSSGLAVIMGRRRLCMRMGIDISVANLKGSIRKVLLMSGLQKYVKIKENSYEIH